MKMLCVRWEICAENLFSSKWRGGGGDAGVASTCEVPETNFPLWRTLH